jgi:protein-arginine kinase activator protein McsA
MILAAAFTVAFTGCNTDKSKATEEKTITTDTASTVPSVQSVYACPMHPDVTGQKGDKCPKCGMDLKEVKKTSESAPTSSNSGAGESVSIKALVTGYLQLKNELTKDNSVAAASSGKALENSFKSFNKSGLNAGQIKIFDDIQGDAIEHAEHIGANSGKIGHQREHFEMLSKDLYDMVKSFGAGQALFKDFCPMYNDNRGAFWLSETKEISNPYLGKAMPKCGTIQEEIK